MKTTISISGLRETMAGLDQLSKAMQRSVLRRVLKRAAKPVEDKAKSRVRADSYESGGLYRSIGTTVLTHNVGKSAFAQAMRGGAGRAEAGQAARAANAAAAGRGASATVRVQATAPHAHLVEGGTVKMAAEPFMGPALESSRDTVIASIKGDLANEINKAARRAAARAAKRASTL